MSDAQAPVEDAPPAGEEETVAVVAEGGDQDEAVEEDVKFSVSVLEVVRTAQNLKGLRDADYMRYRRYCSRKLKRLRRNADIRWGHRRAFKYRMPFPENVASYSAMIVPLFQAERAWAYAMQLKQDQEDHPENSRIRWHLRRRIRKAVVASSLFEEYCNAKGDSRTILEGTAYNAWMHATEHFFREEWREAVEYFVQAKAIYEGLGGTTIQLALYSALVEDITNNVDYCTYNLQRQQGEAIDYNALRDMKFSGNDMLRGKLEDLLTATRKEQAQAMTDITWVGRTVSIRSEALRVAIVAIQEAEFDLEARISQDGFTEDMGLYDAVYGAINNAMQVLRDERAAMPESQSAKVAAQRADLDFIQAHLSAKQLDTMYARSMLMVADATERLRATGRKKAKPEDIVHLHETAIQATHDRDELESAHSEDTELRKENAAQVAALKAKRCFWVAVACATNNKFSEAMALLGRTEERCAYATEQIRACASGAEVAMAMVTEVEAAVVGQRAAIIANNFLNSNTDEEEDDTQYLDPNLPLDKQLSVYAPADLSEPHLTSLPPDFVAVPCKPVFFDLAGNEIEFPDIASRVKGGAASAATSSTPAAASEDGDSGGEPEEPKQSGGWFSSWVG